MEFGSWGKILKIMWYNLWLDTRVPVQHPRLCVNTLLEELSPPQSSKVHLRTIWLWGRYFLSWLKSLSLNLDPLILYVFINTPQLGEQPFYSDLLASYLLVIETFSNVALLTIPYLVLMWPILWTKIGDFTPFGLYFSRRHIINHNLFSLAK